MKRDDMNRLVNKELEYIPRGVSPQSVFRMTYNIVRRQDLGINPATPASESLRRALEYSRKTFPGFSPNCDREFFQI